MIKIDVEGAEWPFLLQVLTTDHLKYIKQLIFEIHTPFRGKHSKLTLQHYMTIYNGLAAMREIWGFKLYKKPSSNNCCGNYPVLIPGAIIGSSEDICCLDMNFINTKFVDLNSGGVQ